jgi:purine-binding chemotaxis protein CheW
LNHALRQLCTFRLDGRSYGVEIDRVQEVLRNQQVTDVPLAPRVVGGLINLRGQIVMAVDLRRCLELAEAPAGRLPMNVVLRTADGPVSLLVDVIDDVVEIPADSFEPPPDTLQGPARRLIAGAYPLADRLLLSLDTDAIVALSGGAAT